MEGTSFGSIRYVEVTSLGSIKQVEGTSIGRFNTKYIIILYPNFAPIIKHKCVLLDYCFKQQGFYPHLFQQRTTYIAIGRF